jgi:hypothetical protein
VVWWRKNNLLLRDCDICWARRNDMPIVEGVCERCNFKCPRCPCRWVVIANLMFAFVEDKYGHHNIAFADGRNGETGTIQPRQVRFALYREYIHMYYGHLGHDNRRDPPKCVKDAIYHEYPNPEGEERIGFRRIGQ